MGAPTLVAAGQVFGRLTVVREVKHKGEKRAFLCVCKCKNEVVVALNGLMKGTTKSCGCLRREMVAAKNTKHGLAPRSYDDRLPEYHIWKRMRQRCNDQNNHEYDRYGGRGITVDPRWDDFSVFLSDMGSRPSSKHSLDRIDNDKPYTPDNVRWATASQQARNKRNNRMITYNGQTMCMAELADLLHVSYSKLAYRLRNGKTIEAALKELGVA